MPQTTEISLPMWSRAMGTERSVTLRRGVLAAMALVAFAFALVPPASAAAKGARETMQSTIDRVIAVLNDPALDFDGRISAIQKIAVERFDLYTMSRLVLSRSWKKFSKEQQDQYVEEFKEYLTNNYGSRINRYDNQQVEIIQVREEQRGDVTVRTRIVGGEFDDARVDYRMRPKGDDWQIIDVTIEGISMVSNFRDQFREVLSNGGPEVLLEKLREKNALGPVEEN